ncbi:MAG: ParB/RepB/Spo0J family partition protein [Candidatus Bathyarchaeota archaeon]|nr:ParB/RepB/Spo0J family partition protein [Candidatus Bathyarchaeota archaeon]MCW4001814.1 ParB/RepB/Spo0J family partition protein [Candidatus Bathyarchaeota archaeon]
MGSQELKSSAERVGQLYPILVDYYGNIIDGKHRFSANGKWKRTILEHIKTEKDRLIARIVSNNLRRTVSPSEKRGLLDRLGEIYFNQGIEPGKIAYEIADATGMSYTWVMKYLPDRFKDNAKSESARATHRVIKEDRLTKLAKENILTIQNYKNTDFVNIIVKKSLYEKLEEKSRKLKTTLDKLVYKAILSILET